MGLLINKLELNFAPPSLDLSLCAWCVSDDCKESLPSWTLGILPKYSRQSEIKNSTYLHLLL